MMWADYAKKLGVGVQSLTKAQKIQAEVNGIMEETRFQTGDAAKIVDTYAGQVSMLSFNFQQLKVAVGNAIMPIVQAVLPAVNELISAMTSLANVAAQVTSALFGKAASGSEDLADANEDAAGSAGDLSGATDDVGDSVQAAAKKIKGSLAPFDDLKKISSSAADGMSDAAGDLAGDLAGGIGGGVLFGDVTVSPEILDFVEKLKRGLESLRDILSRVWKPFSDAWSMYGAPVMDAARRAISSVVDMLKEIGATFLKAWENSGAEKILGVILQMLAGVLSFVSSLADQFKAVWAEMGEGLVDAFFFSVSAVLELIRSIGSAFAEAWNSGVGEQILETILSILTNIFNIVGMLATRLREAWEANGNGVAIWTSILNVVSLVLGFIDRLASATLDWVSRTNFEPLVTAFRNLLQSVEPFVAIVLDGLAWAYENVLLPLASWVIEEAAPAGLDLLSAAIDALTAVIEAIQPSATWLWENLLDPLRTFAWSVIIFSIETITALLTEFSTWARDNKDIIQAMAITIGGLFAVFTMQTIVGIIPTIISALTALFIKFGSFSALFGMLNPSVLALAIGLAAITLGISQLIGVWAGMSSMERSIAIFSALAVAITVAAVAMAVFHTSATLGFAAAGIAAGITLVVASIIAANSAAKRSAGEIGATAASGRSGQSSGGYSVPNGMPSSQSYSIPKLANGAVIPPNQEFAAILGDQKSGRNFEAPEGLVRQIIREEIGNMQFKVNQSMSFEGELGQFVRMLQPKIQTEMKRVGSSTVTVGSY